jgi:hypothetical protein
MARAPVLVVHGPRMFGNGGPIVAGARELIVFGYTGATIALVNVLHAAQERRFLLALCSARQPSSKARTVKAKLFAPPVHAAQRVFGRGGG